MKATNAAEPCSRLLSRRAEAVLRQRRRVKRRGDPGSVHDLRVATRRLQEAVGFFGPFLPPGAARRVRRRARGIRRALGPLRNADVMTALVRRLRRDLPPGFRAKAYELEDRLAADARALRGAGPGGLLAVPGIRKRIRALLARTSRLRRIPLAARAHEVVQERHRAVCRALRGASGGKTSALHLLRIRIKRYRYALELLDQAGWTWTRAEIASARRLQDELGRLHDLDMLIDLAITRAGAAGRRILLPRLRRARQARLVRARASLERFNPERGARAILDRLDEERAA